MDIKKQNLVEYETKSINDYINLIRNTDYGQFKLKANQ